MISIYRVANQITRSVTKYARITLTGLWMLALAALVNIVSLYYNNADILYLTHHEQNMFVVSSQAIFLFRVQYEIFGQTMSIVLISLNCRCCWVS